MGKDIFTERKKIKGLRLLTIYISIILCLLLLFVVNIHYGIEVVYTHIFYLPIILTGIWFYKKAFWVAGFLGIIHIATNLYIGNELLISTFIRATMFIVVAGVVGILSMKKDKLFENLHSREEELRLVNESMLDIISRVNSSGTFEYVSPSVKHILGYSVSEVLSMTFFQLIHPEDQAAAEKQFVDAMNKKEPIRMECRWRHKDGSFIWVESLANPINNGENELGVYVFGSRDINLRKEAEKNLIYLSTHDSLTGLKNRAYHNQIIDAEEKAKNIAVFSFDIDELKLVNDKFGHHEGDKLIIAVSDLLKRTFREKDVVSRVGGDEFIVIAPECDEIKAEMLKKRVMTACSDYNEKVVQGHQKISISVGYAIKKDENTNVEAIIKKADSLMYLYKASRRK